MTARPRGSNEALRAELLAMRVEDQAARHAIMADENDETRARLDAVDAACTARLKAIIAEHGWPGYALVGDDGADCAWLFAQHADRDLAFQRECLPLIERAVAAADADPQHAAYLYDRIAVAEGRPQRYGTQYDEHCKPQPIEDAEHVDDRRRAVGLETLAEYDATMRKLHGR